MIDAVLLLDPPQIKTQPETPVGAYIGDTISLSVEATGAEPIQYQWMKDSVDLGGATSATFAKADAQVSDSGVYAVKVTNPGGTVTSGDAAVTVTVPTLWQILESNPELSTLKAAVETAGLVETLEGAEALTLFAPTDAAFEALPAGVWDALLADPELLMGALTYHALAGSQTTAELVSGDYETLNGASVTVVVTNVILVNNAEVIVADQLASNGVAHVIDAVLLPDALLQVEFAYIVENGTVTITGYTGAGGDVVIPDTIAGLPVTGIGPSAFYYHTDLTSITIPNSVLSIGSWAFENCANLASVVIGQGVASIGYGVFWDCLRLTAVYFEGDAPEMFDDSAFDGSQAIIYYHPGTTGWGPTFGGRPTMPWSLTPGDLDGDGEIDRVDLDVIVAARNTESWGPEDPRDLDGDGIITVLDARILVTLFTVPAGFTRIASSPEGVALEWNENASALTLQSTTDLQGGIWQDVGGLQSPTNTVIGTTSERTFFRLVLPE